MLKEKILWRLLFLEFFVMLASGLGILFHWPFTESPAFTIVAWGTIPVLLLVLHAFWTLTVRRGLFFIALAGLTGLAFEIAGVRYGTVFGGQYEYHTTQPLIQGVPLLVILYWAIFIYLGYAITTSFAYWQNKAKPSIHNGKPALLLALIAGDGIVVTAIDLFLDPIKVRAGAWTWLHGGVYFGVPLRNFVGWFVVTIIVTAIFRLFEYFYPQQPGTLEKSAFLMPVAIYAALAFLFTLQAVHFGMYSLIAVGLPLMLLICGANLFFYRKAAIAS